ncbi:MAG: hypothetical protein ACPG3U_10865 [Rhodothermales bacterium]
MKPLFRTIIGTSSANENPPSAPSKVAPDGKVWVVLFGTNRLAHFDIENETLREYDLPREEARPRRMEITSDGRIW